MTNNLSVVELKFAPPAVSPGGDGKNVKLSVGAMPSKSMLVVMLAAARNAVLIGEGNHDSRWLGLTARPGGTGRRALCATRRQ